MRERKETTNPDTSFCRGFLCMFFFCLLPCNPPFLLIREGKSEGVRDREGGNTGGSEMQLSAASNARSDL